MIEIIIIIIIVIASMELQHNIHKEVHKHTTPNVSQTDANRDVFGILTITISSFTVLLIQVQLIPP